MTETTERSSEALKFARKLDKLMRRMVGVQFEDVEDMWVFQTDLLELQRDIQRDISREKKAAASSRDLAGLEQLREMRQFARLVGDSFAWLVLGMDARLVQSLSENAPVPISEDDHGSVGMIAIATHLSNEGWGFPLIHDITDCLRIGDITFIRPTESDRDLRTVEVKTRFKGKILNDEGGSSSSYQVSVIYTDHDPDLKGSPPADSIEVPEKVDRKKRPTRVDRQVERMTRAQIKGKADWDTITEIPDEHPLISTTFDSQHASHWKTLRRVIRAARASGYAGECVDGAFFYTAFYNANGLDQETIQNETFVQELTTSGLLGPSPWGHENSIAVSAVPRRNNWDKSMGYNFRPFFLYDIPQKAKTDVLFGRLAIMIIWNPARIFDLIRSSGFELQLDSKTGQPDPSVVLRLNFEDSLGRSWTVEQHNMIWHVYEVIFEFKSIHFLVEAITHVAKAAESAFSNSFDAEGQPAGFLKSPKARR